jgi:proteasome lid subunit RPN8/RPN11
MGDSALSYRIPGAAWSLEFPASAVQKLLSNAQRRCWSREAAGQLYSAVPGDTVVRIDAVTRLPSRAASRTGLQLDIPAADRERKALFQTGMHCIGFWHTHPEPTPCPSAADIAMAADHARAGVELFTGLVFVIVGTAAAPDGLGVWVNDGTTMWQALPQLQAASSACLLLS